MCLNKLLYDHQMALMRAAQVPPAMGECELVDHFENLLQAARRKLGVAQYPVAAKHIGDLKPPILSDTGNLT